MRPRLASPAQPQPKPLDPASPKGREVAARLSATLADVRDAITARKARAAEADAHPTASP